MHAKAQAKFQRISPKKVRLVVDLIRNLGVEQAKAQLKVSPKNAAAVVGKVLESAVANAEHNNKVKKDELHVVAGYVDQGPTLKRWRPRAYGRASQIRKRTSHITVVVGDKASKKEKPETKKSEVSKEEKKTVKKEEK
jgi:large subunit ribosomal protein L22